MKILVTGGTGFLGTRITTSLVADGHDVLALSRSDASDGKLRTLGAQPVRGSLSGQPTLALPAIDAVVHAGALFRLGGPRREFFRTNVDGTAALLRAARQAGARTFVYISAAGIVMDERGSPLRNVGESAPTYPDHFSPYLASKSRGEALVLAADTAGFRTVSLRPPAIWGAGDMFSRALPHAIASGRFAFIERGEYDYATCHADNVVEAVQCALERGPGGKAYFICDRDRFTFREFIGMIASAQGLSIEKIRSMPYGAAFALGRVMETVWAMTLRKDDPPLSRSMVRMIGRSFSIDDSAARRDLGYVGKVSRADGIRSYAADRG